MRPLQSHSPPIARVCICCVSRVRQVCSPGGRRREAHMCALMSGNVTPGGGGASPRCHAKGHRWSLHVLPPCELHVLSVSKLWCSCGVSLLTRLVRAVWVGGARSGSQVSPQGPMTGGYSSLFQLVCGHSAWPCALWPRAPCVEVTPPESMATFKTRLLFHPYQNKTVYIHIALLPNCIQFYQG